MSQRRQCLPIKFEMIEAMPELPKLAIPDYNELSGRFAEYAFSPENGILHYDDNLNPCFTSYTEGRGSEMVTWGILAIGEKLRGRDAEWLSSTYSTFFNDRVGIYLNSAVGERIEYWYLFYVNILAGAVMRTLYTDDKQVYKRWMSSADAMQKLARKVNYNFNEQGFEFNNDRVFTVKDIYRQPDSIAGYGYNMLFTAVHSGEKKYLDEAIHALKLYQNMQENPWYEIPNGSAAVLAATWLRSKGYDIDVERIIGYVFDHEKGPLQVGEWNGEEINGLMMGWRGDDRESALSSAYSMETLMPLQFLLPAVRYMPCLAASIGKYVLHVLANFQLFYGRGMKAIYETKPGTCASIPYEKLEAERDGRSPCACGDFFGHRSVYGGGYVMWLDAMVRKTEFNHVPALDISLTDWLSKASYPTFTVYNPYEREVNVSFDIAKRWQDLCPQLYREGKLHNFDIYSLDEHRITARRLSDKVAISIPGKSACTVVLLPGGSDIEAVDGWAYAKGIPFDFSYKKDLQVSTNKK